MNLFYNFNESNVVENVRMKWPSDEYVIPQGTPMSRTGIANNGDAIGILARDAVVKFPYPLSVAKLIGKKEPKGNEDYTFAIITSGFLNLSEVEKVFGGKISDEAKKAMVNINFVDDKAPKSFGGGASSWNDLKDKPFGESPYTVYAEGEVSTDSEQTEGDGVFYGYLDDIFAIEVGKAYNVTIDGVLYENVECYAKNDYYGSPYLGASSGEEIKNNTSQYPFQVTFEGYYKTYMVYTKENAIHTVKVEALEPSTKKIDEKYLPDVVLTSPNGYRFKLVVSDDGVLSAEEIY